MDVATLKAKIKAKQLPSYLIFSGDEWKVQDIYINQIAKVTKSEIQRVEGILQIYSKLQNRSILKNKIIYIVRDDKDLMQNEKLQEQIKNGLLGNNILIHILTTVDKRTKFYKAYKDNIIEFEPLPDDMLKKYIKKEITLSDRNCQILIDICEHDYGRCLLEIDKIKRYALLVYPEVGHENENGDYNRTLDELLKDGTIYEPPYDAIFDLVDVILDRKVNKTFDLLQQSYDVGEATMVMLSVLYTNVKAVLQVQTYDGNNSLSKGTGLTGWQIKNAKPHVGKYSDNELMVILKLIQNIESGIKTGKMEDEFAMQYLLTHIL